MSRRYIGAGGAGGQSVNKCDTKVHATCAVFRIRGLSEQELWEIRHRLGAHISKNGEVFVDMQDKRTQERNRVVAMKRLEAKIVAAAQIPAKRKRRARTPVHRKSGFRGKRRRSLLKVQRMTKTSFD